MSDKDDSFKTDYRIFFCTNEIKTKYIHKIVIKTSKQSPEHGGDVGK